MPKQSGIYIIYNTVNKKKYIGSSVDVMDRWRQHKRALRSNYHVNHLLQNAWNKYGESSFLFKILEIVERNNLVHREQEYINDLVPEYNIVKNVSHPMFGRVHTEESKKKMSDSRKGTGNAFWGKKHTEETKRKLSEYRKGKKFGKHSDETRMKMSKSSSGINNGFYGKTHSMESKKRIGRAKIGRVLPKESREEISKKIRGEKHYNAQLNNKSVEEIRLLWSSGKYSQIEIGKMFKVSNKVVSSIVNFRTWKQF